MDNRHFEKFEFDDRIRPVTKEIIYNHLNSNIKERFNSLFLKKDLRKEAEDLEIKLRGDFDQIRGLMLYMQKDTKNIFRYYSEQQALEISGKREKEFRISSEKINFYKNSSDAFNGYKNYICLSSSLGNFEVHLKGKPNVPFKKGDLVKVNVGYCSMLSLKNHNETKNPLKIHKFNCREGTRFFDSTGRIYFRQGDDFHHTIRDSLFGDWSLYSGPRTDMLSISADLTLSKEDSNSSESCLYSGPVRITHSLFPFIESLKNYEEPPAPRYGNRRKNTTKELELRPVLV